MLNSMTVEPTYMNAYKAYVGVELKSWTLCMLKMYSYLYKSVFVEMEVK